jgi:uncharacterized RDD family membrane protein YckC
MDEQGENYLGHYAGFGSRLIAYAIDSIVAIVGISIIWWLINITIEILRVREVIDYLGWTVGYNIIFDPNDEFVLRGIVMILGVGLYHVFFLTLANRTIGKSLMGLQVVPLKGGRIGIFRATLRYFGYIVSIIPLFFGFIWILFSRRRQGWHDKIAGTCVVYTWDAKPDDVFLYRGLIRLQKANEQRFGPPPEIADLGKERSD